MRSRKIAVAQMLISESAGSVSLQSENEDEYIYQARGKTVRIKPGGTLAIKNGDEWESQSFSVPQDIVDLQDVNMKDFHSSLKGWLSESRRFKEEAKK